MTWILGLLGAIMLGLVKDEISAWIPSLARWCVCRAADRMPDRQRSREEWLAHLEECPGKLGQLAHALGVLGIGQARRMKFWLSVLRHFPGIRWTIIDNMIVLAGLTTTVLSGFSWWMASDLTVIFITANCALVVISFFIERRARTLLTQDQEIIRLATAYLEARDR